MKTNRMQRSVGWVGMLALAGCTVGPDFKAPAANLPSQWAEGPADAGITESPAELTEWWNGFGDAELTSLVARAAAANPDVKAAVLRIEEARAQAGVAGAAAWPNVNLQGGAQRQRISEKTAITSLIGSAAGGASHAGGNAGAGIPGAISGFPNPFDQVQAGLDAQWEIDLFGRVRRSVEAARAQVGAAEEDARAARLELIAETAEAYLDLRGAQAALALLRQSLDTERQGYALARERWQSGLTNELEMQQAAAQVAATEAELAPAEGAVEAQMNRVGLLLALPPGALREELAEAKPLPPVPPEVPAGVPGELARRRPDIREAEARLHAATAQMGVAVADLYPSITLTGTAGFSAERLSGLSDWASRYGSIGPSLDLPIFDANRRRATMKVQDIRVQEAAVAYANTVLQALHECENALLNYRTERAHRAALTVEAARTADVLTLARQRYESGLTSFLNVLDAERANEGAALAVAQSETAEATDLVRLYRALGGGV